MAGLLITYSVSCAPDGDPTSLLEQLDISLTTLRRCNEGVPVVVFAHGWIPAALRRICHHHAVHLVNRGDYAARLAGLCPRGAPILAGYPVLHKFLNHDWLADVEVEQVLACDCDTVFRADPEQLCRAYQDADLVAREEVHTQRNAHPPDRDFLDEPAVTELARVLGVASVPPFNTGVVLLNHGIWQRLAQVQGWFVNCAWHLLLGMALSPGQFNLEQFGTLDRFRDATRLASWSQLISALPYPSANQWILEEISCWLAVGAVPGLSTADFLSCDVAQNGEFAATDPAAARWTLCHYYSGNQDRIRGWLTEQPAAVTH